MSNREAIIRLLSETITQPTAHQIGLKQILLANDETSSAITQISVATLRKGEQVENHIHKTMDEHYLFLSGRGFFFLDGKKIECKEGLFLLVPAGTPHYMWAETELKCIIIGVAFNYV